jgi:hypothetical protein
MFQLRWLVALSLVVVMLAGAALASAAGPVTVQLNAQNDSGETGTATLTDLGNGKVQVELTVTGAPAAPWFTVWGVGPRSEPLAPAR